MLGGADPSHYTGEFTYMPAEKYEGLQAYWLIHGDDIKVDGTSMASCKGLLSSKCQFVVDTGTSILTGPSKKSNTAHRSRTPRHRNLPAPAARSLHILS